MFGYHSYTFTLFLHIRGWIQDTGISTTWGVWAQHSGYLTQNGMLIGKKKHMSIGKENMGTWSSWWWWWSSSSSSSSFNLEDWWPKTSKTWNFTRKKYDNQPSSCLEKAQGQMAKDQLWHIATMLLVDFDWQTFACNGKLSSGFTCSFTQ